MTRGAGSPTLAIMRRFRFLPLLFILPVASAPLADATRARAPSPTPEAILKAQASELHDLFENLRYSETAEEASKAEAEIFIRLTVSKSPTINLLLESAAAALGEQNEAKARAILGDAVALDPEFAEGLARAASLAYQAGELDRARALLKRALAVEPRHFAAWAGLGMVLEDENELEGAKRAYEEALYLHPFLDGAKRGLIRIEAKTDGLSL